MHEDISIAEAAAALRMEIEEACQLFGRRNRLTVSDVLGMRIATELLMLGTKTAATVARVAATEASSEGRPRLFAVIWDDDRQPKASWLGGTVPRDLTRAVLVLPVDAWLKQLIERIAAQRAALAHLN